MGIRIRLSRAKGFNLQAHSISLNGLPALSVGRPGPWGNPLIVGKDGTREDVVDFFRALLNGDIPLTASAGLEALRDYRRFALARRNDLRGHNLACWCALDGKPCHADVLLELSNGPFA